MKRERRKVLTGLAVLAAVLLPVSLVGAEEQQRSLDVKRHLLHPPDREVSRTESQRAFHYRQRLDREIRRAENKGRLSNQQTNSRYHRAQSERARIRNQRR